MAPMIGHWTKDRFTDFVYRISFDFVAQLRNRLEEKSLTRSEFAKLVRVGESRVSQVFNNPGNLGLESMTRYARALGMKIAIVAYDDGDSENQNGPVNSEIFNLCWKRAGAPKDFFAFNNQIRQLVQLPDTSDTIGFTPGSNIGYTYPIRSEVNHDTRLVRTDA